MNGSDEEIDDHPEVGSDDDLSEDRDHGVHDEVDFPFHYSTRSEYIISGLFYYNKIFNFPGNRLAQWMKNLTCLMKTMTIWQCKTWRKMGTCQS